MGKDTVIAFTWERETKGTNRYQEVVKDGEEAAIGTIYIRKSASPKMDKFTMTIKEG